MRSVSVSGQDVPQPIHNKQVVMIEPAAKQQKRNLHFLYRERFLAKSLSVYLPIPEM